MIETERTALAEWKAHWTLVLAASIGFSFTSFMSPAIGIFMAPVSHDFGWSRSQFTAGIAIAGLLSVLFSPLFGLLLDRFGARRIALPGIVILSVAVTSLGLANGNFAQWIGLWVFWGIASLAVHSMTWSAAVASVFSKGRGLALGLTLSGTALSLVIVPPLANYLLTTHGWRSTFLYLGVGWGAVALLLSVLFLYDARDRSRLKMDKQDAANSAALLPGLTVAEAWRSVALWKVGISTFLILVVTIAVTVHQFEILVASGETRANAAWLSSLAGIAAIAGKLITGSLLDKFHARWVGGITLASTAVAYPLLMAQFHNPALIVVAMMISGYAGGTKIQLCGFLTARYAGLRNFGVIFGVMSGLIALAGAVGPVSASAAFDHFGDYGVFLIVGTILSLLCGALVASLGAYPVWSGRADADEIEALEARPA